MKKNQDSNTPQELLHDLQALVAEAEGMIAASETTGKSDDAGSLRTRFDAARERVSEAYSTARKKVVAGARSTDQAIRTHPYQSLAVAAVVGLMLGAYLGRRSR